MKISKEALAIIAKGSLGVSKAVSPKSIGVDVTGLAGEGKDESNTPDTKPKETPKDKPKETPKDKPKETPKDTTPQRELNLKEVEKYSSSPDEGELGFPKFSSFENVANQYQGQEHKAPFPP